MNSIVKIEPLHKKETLYSTKSAKDTNTHKNIVTAYLLCQMF